MQPTQALSPAAAFFFEHAGYSYGPDETREQGATRCAIELADAETKGREAGLSFTWEVDPDQDSSSFTDARPKWRLFQCLAHNRDGEALASLCGIDFGRNGSPEGEPYARVVEAELAQQALAR